MKKRLIAALATILLILITTLLLTNCFGTFNPSNPCPSPSSSPTPTPTPQPTIIVPDDYPTISSAIENAKNGYKIIVKSGTYNEQTLNISKSLTIVSQYQNGAHIILHPYVREYYVPWHKERVYADAIQINSNNFGLSGFSITSQWSEALNIGHGGRFVANGNGIQILNNNMAKISLTLNGNESKIVDNSIESLTLTGNDTEVYNNQILNMAISGQLNFINENHASTICVAGNNNTLSSNQVIGGGSVGIQLVSAKYNVVWNNTESGHNVGFAIGNSGNNYCNYNFFGANTVRHAFEGILVYGSYNVFYGNLVIDCGSGSKYGYGLAIEGIDIPPVNNLFFSNSFINNSRNLASDHQIVGSNFFDNGVVGNYWDDYLGTGIYRVYDKLPLVESPGLLTDMPALPSPWQLTHFRLP